MVQTIFLHLESEKSTLIIKDRIFFQVEVTVDELTHIAQTT